VAGRSSYVVRPDGDTWIVDTVEKDVRTRWVTREQAVMAANRMAAARGEARIIVHDHRDRPEAEYRFRSPSVEPEVWQNEETEARAVGE
jgi:hypothetical protein